MNKPPYRIPSMKEIEALPHNGLNVVSTFSGCGGSCLGYRLAGYRVLWANEFVPAAQDTYRANHPHTHLSTSDVRSVTAADIREVIGDIDVDLFDGSPPCASFSMAGKRQQGWGQVRKYSDVEQRTDDLFEQYIRLLDELRPRAFIAENVAGMTLGVGKGFFKRYLSEMRELPYHVEARLISSQFLGVPQARTRVIFMGVRHDVGRPRWPTPLPYQYTVRDALSPMPDVDERPLGLPSRQKDKVAFSVQNVDLDKPCPTITTKARNDLTMFNSKGQRVRLYLNEIIRLSGFPDDFVLTGTEDQQWERLGRVVPPPMMAAISHALIEVLK